VKIPFTTNIRATFLLLFQAIFSIYFNIYMPIYFRPNFPYLYDVTQDFLNQSAFFKEDPPEHREAGVIDHLTGG
jgi:hypothetical protein